jgi:hypothetical protein
MTLNPAFRENALRLLNQLNVSNPRVQDNARYLTIPSPKIICKS